MNVETSKNIKNEMNQRNKKNNQAHKITNVYKSEYKQQRYMTDNEYKILWTLIWFIFIGVLCLHFNNGWSLLLLVFWLMGVV